MSEPLSSPTLSSSSFDIPSPPTYDSDDEIVWSLSSSSISTGSSNDFVVLSRASSNVPPEADSVSESSVLDLASSVDSLSSSDASASILGQLPPPLPLAPSRMLNVDYPTPTATPTPRTTYQSVMPSATAPDSPTEAQLKEIRKARQAANKVAKAAVKAAAKVAKTAAKAAAKVAKKAAKKQPQPKNKTQVAEQQQAKLLKKARKAAATAIERKAIAQKATAKAQAAQARAQLVVGKTPAQIAQDKLVSQRATKEARKARKSARKAEKNVVKSEVAVAAAAAKEVAKFVNAVQATTVKVKKPAPRVVQVAKKSPPTTPKAATISVGLGSRPVIDDSAASEVAFEEGDDPSSFAEASQFITSYINDPETAQTKSKVHRLALLQSIIVECGVGTTSMLPRTITAAKAFVKSTVFVNVQDYLAVRTQGQEALKRILLPNRKALIKDIRRTGPTPRTLVKQHGLQALLVLTH